MKNDIESYVTNENNKKSYVTIENDIESYITNENNKKSYITEWKQ